MKKSDKIKVIVKPPRRIAHFEWIDNTLEALQKIVGGYIEVVTLAPDLALICNEEGRIYGLPLNCNICGVTFVGTIIAVGVNGEEFEDVPISVNEFIDYMDGKRGME